MSESEARTDRRNALLRLRAATRAGDAVLCYAVPGLKAYRALCAARDTAEQKVAETWKPNSDRLLQHHTASIVARDALRASAVIFGFGLAILIVGEQLLPGAIAFVTLLPGIMAFTALNVLRHESDMIEDRGATLCDEYKAARARQQWLRHTVRLFLVLRRRMSPPISLFSQHVPPRDYRLVDKDTYRQFADERSVTATEMRSVQGELDQLEWADAVIARRFRDLEVPASFSPHRISLLTTWAFCAVACLAAAASLSFAFFGHAYAAGVWGLVASIVVLASYGIAHRDVALRRAIMHRVAVFAAQRTRYADADRRLRFALDHIFSEYERWPVVHIRQGVPAEALVLAQLETIILATSRDRHIDLTDGISADDSVTGTTTR